MKHKKPPTYMLGETLENNLIRTAYYHMIILPRDRGFRIARWDIILQQANKELGASRYFSPIEIMKFKEYTMARKSWKSEYSFIQWKPSPQQLDEIIKEYSPETDFQGSLAELGMTEHKISISYSLEHSCFYFSVTCKNNTSPNDKKVFTVRHDNLHKAMHTFFYAHEVLAGYDWSTLESADSSW